MPPDILTNQDKKSEGSTSPPKFVIGVRIRGTDKSDLCDPGSLSLKVGQQVMVNTADGTKMGVVASNKIINFGKVEIPTLKVLRIANTGDLQKETEKKEREINATQICLELIDKLNVPMNLSRVVYFEEMKKSIFYFTAEGRVDFRELVKELAARLRHRIEMRQVGVRDEAKAVTGLGMCGQSLCCSTFLLEFTPVTIRMAKDQGLALNPSKISGVCGRLMCCLQYEHNVYRELIKELPKVGKPIQTPEGPGKVIKNDILKQIIIVRLEDESIIYYHLDELRDSLKANKTPTPSPSSEEK